MKKLILLVVLILAANAFIFKFDYQTVKSFLYDLTNNPVSLAQLTLQVGKPVEVSGIKVTLTSITLPAPKAVDPRPIFHLVFEKGAVSIKKDWDPAAEGSGYEFNGYKVTTKSFTNTSLTLGLTKK